MGKFVIKSYMEDIYFESMIHNERSDTIILLKGFPSTSENNHILNFFYEKGFNIIIPYYKGSFQSEGEFLKEDPTQDMRRFIASLTNEEIINLWDYSKLRIRIKDLFLIGSSFSGAIACGLLKENFIKKLILFSPVWDYSKHNTEYEEQDLDKLVSFVKRAYKYLYRFSWSDIRGKFKEFDSCKYDNYKFYMNKPILVLHDPKDKTVSIEQSRFMEKTHSSVSLIETSNGHSFNETLSSEWDGIRNFIYNS